MNRRTLSVFVVGIALAILAIGVAGTYIAGDRQPADPATTEPATGTVASGTETKIDTATDGSVRLRAAAGQVVRGETTLPAGTNLSVEVGSIGEQPFRRSAVVSVADDGTFQATIDLAQVPVGTPYLVTVRRNGSTLATARGEIAGGPGAGATTIDQGETNASVDGDRLTLAGETTVSAGTNLSIRVQSTGERPVLRRTWATVTRDGSYRTTVNLTGVPPGTPVEVTITDTDSTLVVATGDVVAVPTGIPSSRTQESDSTVGGGTARVFECETLTLAGATTAPTGTNLAVFLRSTGEKPFLHREETTVAANGTFRTTVDLTQAPPGTPVTVSVSHDGSSLATVTGDIVGSSTGTDTTPVWDG